MIDLKKCMFLSGGKRLNLSNPDSVPVTIKRNADNSWSLNFDFKIIEEEAKDVLHLFNELNTTEADLPKDHPNVVYLEILNPDNTPKPIECSNIYLTFVHDKEETGCFHISFDVDDAGKTQSAKNQSGGAQ